MTLLYFDPVFLEHHTGDHPESADRIIPVIRHLNFVTLDTQCVRPSWQVLSLQRLSCVHSLSYHHGNGSQATFWEDTRVGYLSIHRWPFYPFTCGANETGGGKALGMTLNLPVTFRTPRAATLPDLPQNCSVSPPRSNLNS